MAWAAVTTSPLSVADHLAAVAHPAAGAVDLFVGQVRDHDPAAAAAVVGLEYSAHPDAERILAGLVEEAGTRPGVLGVAASHRCGVLPVGEIAVVVAVATAHRDLAFAVCRDLIELIKVELPVWKRELLVDGSHVWVGLR